MKRVSLILIALLSISHIQAQNQTGFLNPNYPSIVNCAEANDYDKDKFATFGFDLGVNRSNLQFGDTQTNGDQITNGLGYRLGIVSDFRVTKRFSIAPKAELSFNASRLDQSNTSYNVNATNLEFLGHLKYKFAKGNFSPNIIAGPNFRVPLQKTQNSFVSVKNDMAIDFGVGLDVPMGYFKMSPELRYSYGCSNITQSSQFSDLYYHNIALTLIFSDN